MLLRNRPLLYALLALLFLAEFSLGAEFAARGFDWRPLWDAPVVKATLIDFTVLAMWCTLYLFDTARREGRSPWAWLPLTLILPSAALLLFSLTAPREPRDASPGSGA